MDCRNCCGKVGPDGQLHPVEAGGIGICLCGVSTLYFNAGPGDVAVDFHEASHPAIPSTKLWFRSGGRTDGSPTPAWKYTAAPALISGADRAKNTWNIGFIQTVESFEAVANYDGGWNRKRAAGRSRDSFADDGTYKNGAPAPWYGVPNSTSEPVLVQKCDRNPNLPTIDDDPMTVFPVLHPEAICHNIRTVTMKATFRLWLIAIDPAAVVNVANMKFLWHATIKIDRSWEFPKETDTKFTFIPSYWKCSGSQAMSDRGPGSGTYKPVPQEPVANLQLVNVATEIKGRPCPKTGAK
jgi:hypothetical protein